MSGEANGRTTGRRRSFLRAVALTVGVTLLSPLSSTALGPIALVGLPTAIGLVAFQWRRPLSLLIGVTLLVGLLSGVAGRPPTAWYLERAWALLIGGGFVIATALGPERTLFVRAVTGLLVAATSVAVVAALRPEVLTEVDWRIAAQYDRAAVLFELQGQRWDAVRDVVNATAAVAKQIYPALLGLASLGALCLASYVMRRVAGVEAGLAPLRTFRFSDHLAWLLIGGLILFLLPMGMLADRAGENVMMFMGGLYVLRGIAVLAWIGTTVVSSTGWIVLWLVAAVLFYPVTVGAALVMGLSDTWLDLRSRLGVEPEEQ